MNISFLLATRRKLDGVLHSGNKRDICHHDAGPLDGEGNPAVNFITAFI